MVFLILCVIEYISGGTLKARIQDLSDPLPWLHRVKFAQDIASGMVKQPTRLVELICLLGSVHSWVLCKGIQLVLWA